MIPIRIKKLVILPPWNPCCRTFSNLIRTCTSPLSLAILLLILTITIPYWKTNSALQELPFRWILETPNHPLLVLTKTERRFVLWTELNFNILANPVGKIALSALKGSAINPFQNIRLVYASVIYLAQNPLTENAFIHIPIKISGFIPVFQRYWTLEQYL